MNESNPIVLPQVRSAPQEPPLVMPPVKQHNTISSEWGSIPFYTYALPKQPPETLAAALRAAPHLAACGDHVDTAPEKPLRLVLYTDHFPTAVQAAVCLSACHSAPDAAAAEEASWGDLWEELDRELGLDESVPPPFPPAARHAQKGFDWTRKTTLTVFFHTIFPSDSLGRQGLPAA